METSLTEVASEFETTGFWWENEFASMLICVKIKHIHLFSAACCDVK